METLYKIQPTEIEQLMQEKLADRKIDDEFGWTGEWRMSAKNVLDLIIDLNVLEQLEKMEADKAELLNIIKGLVSDVGNLIGEHDIEWQQAGYFEYAKEVIQKHKQ